MHAYCSRNPEAGTMILSTTEVAGMLNVNESTVKRWAGSGTLRCFKTPGGHRKFTQEDVTEFIARYGFGSETPESEPATKPPSGDAITTKNYSNHLTMLTEKLLHGGNEEAFQFLRLLSRNRYTLQELYDYIVAGALQEIGTMWVERKVSIEQEHIATNNLLFAIRSLQNELIKKTLISRTALCGCFEGEFHEVGITCVRNLLDAEGWTTYYLGPNLPVNSFINAVDRYRPHLVCVSSTTPKSKFQFRKDCALLHAATSRIGSKLMIGGNAPFHVGKRKIAADCIPATFTEALQWIGTADRTYPMTVDE